MKAKCMKGALRSRIVHYTLFIIHCMVFCAMLPACGEMESWTTNPDVRLSFSRDTLAFDTVITGAGSATQTLIVRNGKEDGVRIAQIRLAKGAESPFRVNVDGQYLYNGIGQDFEVRGEDSIYVRAFVKMPVTDSHDIEAQQDELQFTLENGVVQRVVLTSSGLNVTVLRAMVVDKDMALPTERPYQVFDSLVVNPGCTLTLPAGCTLMLHDGTDIIVYGTLRAEGTLEKPVVLRGDRTDRMFPYLPYDNTPNRWGGVHITAESRGNSLVQLDLHSSDYGITVDSTDVASLNEPVLTLENSVLHNIGGPGLTLRNTWATVIGTQLSNTLGDVLSVTGGDVQFIHCTLAQFYPFSANRGYALWLANKEGENELPLKRAHFLNCVITGYADDVVMGNLTEEEEGMEKINYLFQNSLLRTVASDDMERFRDIRYDVKDSVEQVADKNFKLFDTDNFWYDFAPDSLSSIRGLADYDYAHQYPVDRRGISRLADGEPDAGAYEGQ